MTRTRHRAATLLAGAALVVPLAACGGSAQGEEPSPEDTMGPLDEFFEDIYGGWDEETANAQQMEVEEITARCMSEQGFEYIPVDWSQAGGGVSYSDEDLDVEWGTKEFAEKYGYGASIDPWNPDGEEPVVEPAPEDEFVDPNWAIQEAMSETERMAYQEALYGNAEWVEGEEPPGWEEQGCMGRAQHEVYEGDVDTAEFEDLQAEMERMWESIQDDPRIAEINAEWSSCMADAGHSGLATVDDAPNIIYEKMNALWDDAYEDMPPDAGEEDYLAIEEQVQAMTKELQDEELALASADYECRDEVDYEPTMLEVNHEIQQDFVDAHREELEAWREAAAAGRG